MPDAIEELEILREIERLTSWQRAAVVVSSLDPRTAEKICARLTGAEFGRLLWEAGLLPAVSDGVRRRLLTEFRARLDRRRRREERENVSPAASSPC